MAVMLSLGLVREQTADKAPAENWDHGARQ